MANSSKVDRKQRVIMGAREYGISTVLFRHAVGEQLGVNVTDMECLGLLFFKGLATPTQLAAYTGLTSGATTAMLDRLEKSGMVQRQPNPADRRGTLIVLDRAGAEKVGQWFASVRKAQNALVSSYRDKELDLIADFFERSTRMWEEAREQLQRDLANPPGRPAARRSV
jgi:DNA-binding MarR family transcriptional regulator